jgi:S1-C subfamily serine protease
MRPETGSQHPHGRIERHRWSGLLAPDPEAAAVIPLLACILLLWGPHSAESSCRGHDTADAVAFIRVYGNVKVHLTDEVKIGVTDEWGGPEAFEDVEIRTGSGFVVAPSGLVVTNHHVVTGGRATRIIDGVEREVSLEITRVETALKIGDEYDTMDASVVVSDPELDLAALQLTAADLPCMVLGDSDAVVVGQRVRVVGFPFGRDVEVGRPSAGDVVPDPSVTVGTLSAARSDEEGRRRYLQTDASVHGGSSGGPILDREGHAIGVVEMKLTEGGQTHGPGFGIPINLVKDFLEGAGLLFEVPQTPLREGFVHELDWKGMQIDLPEGMVDESLQRLRVATGGEDHTVSFLAGRFVAPGRIHRMEKALLQGRIVHDFVPTREGELRRVRRGVPGRLVGSAYGLRADGQPFRLEYALLEVGDTGEKVVARFLGSPEDVAYNLSLLRRSLDGMEAMALLTDEVRSPLEVTFDLVRFGRPTASLPVPADWSREPATRAACGGVPPAEAGLATTPPGDFTVVLRALRWPEAEIQPETVAKACGQPQGTPALAYSRRERRLGVDIGVWGAFQRRGGEVFLLEVEAPAVKLGFVRELYVEWLGRVAE